MLRLLASALSLLLLLLCAQARATDPAPPLPHVPLAGPFISDKVFAPLRSEPGEKGKLLHKGMESGTAVTVLEKNEANGYTKIRTAEGLEGWVRTPYLSDEQPAFLQLEQANAQLAQLHTEKAVLAEELMSIKQISSSQIDTHERNIELVQQNQLLISEKEVLMTDNERLKDRNSQTWFLYGGLLVVLSALLATIIGKLGKARRSDGWA